MTRIRLAGYLLAASPALAPAAFAQSPAPAPTATSNPLLVPWTGEYGGVPPWQAGSPERYREAIPAALAARKRDVAAITNQTAAPTFENTIAALENCGRQFDRVARMFAVMTDNESTEEYEALNAEMAPKIAAATDEILLDAKLFARIRALKEKPEKPALTAEQKRLLDRTFEQFTRAGAGLSPAQKQRISAINQELAGHFADFQKRVVADENTWVVLDKEADLAGLPPSRVAAAKAAAEKRELPGKWIVVNTRSSVDPFLTFSSRRDLREKVWRAFTSRGDNGNANDTNELIARIVKLRAERAKILGYASHAHWRMQDTMARDPQNATALMMRVWAPAVARVGEEVADMQKIVDTEKGGFKIEPWDYKYYAEKVRKERYDLDQSEVSAYFELNNMIDAAFWSAGELYGLTFKEVTGKVPVFQPDVRVWEVHDKTSGKFVSLFYGDYFARAGKRSGAWQTSYRSRESFKGPVTPLVSNNNNFVASGAGEPTLISLDDAETLFHEFGHALHEFVSEVNYPGLGETPRDFVEFPSQINEHWVLTREVLDRYARHWKTKEAMPQALIDKIQRSRKFNQGFATVEYLASAIVDMQLHLDPKGEVDPKAFERQTLGKIGMPKELVMRHRLPQFNHLFTSDAYSAGYYSYLWSETMDADTWQAFETAGVWDKKTAEKFRRLLLAPGNSVDLGEAYREFRGRDPDVAALLAQRGLDAPTAGAGGATATGARER